MVPSGRGIGLIVVQAASATTVPGINKAFAIFMKLRPAVCMANLLREPPLLIDLCQKHGGAAWYWNFAKDQLILRQAGILVKWSGS